MTNRDKQRILANTREMLSMAHAGLADAKSPGPRRRRPGLMNLFTYGRSVTMAMQTMKHTDPAFEAWWQPYQAMMKSDPLMQYFNKTRTEIMHEGELTTVNYTVIGAEGPVNMGEVFAELSKHAPPNTVATFLGDQLGGNGWEVRMPDGSTEHVYFQLPGDVDIESGLQLHHPPDQHDGKPITDNSIATIGGLYVATLDRIVDEFVTRFSEDGQL
ncbi:MAG: hypothetical protein WKF96_00735 [Solirubrobacteraceae bacterium]